MSKRRSTIFLECDNYNNNIRWFDHLSSRFLCSGILKYICCIHCLPTCGSRISGRSFLSIYVLSYLRWCWSHFSSRFRYTCTSWHGVTRSDWNITAQWKVLTQEVSRFYIPYSTDPPYLMMCQKAITTHRRPFVQSVLDIIYGLFCAFMNCTTN